jgi:hypothetical protein
MLDQAAIAARASAIVSFNIEFLSSVAFMMCKGSGFFVPRNYFEPLPYVFYRATSTPGASNMAVYFPHGLLDLTGQCVITESEYALHSVSLAVGTAVNLCVGGDLLILGMSLNDAYLRDALLRQRRWIREVNWIAPEHSHREWARVARVTCVRAPVDQIWTGLATRMIDEERKFGGKDLSEHRRRVGDGVTGAIERARAAVAGVPDQVERIARKFVSGTHFSSTDLRNFAHTVIDLGLDVPQIIKDDPRYF